MLPEVMNEPPPCGAVAVAALPEHDAAVVAFVALVALVAFVAVVAFVAFVAFVTAVAPI
jgi:hypothetical protein